MLPYINVLLQTILKSQINAKASAQSSSNTQYQPDMADITAVIQSLVAFNIQHPNINRIRVYDGSAAQPVELPNRPAPEPAA
ncbi:MAG: hypothetical protein Q9194_004092 [Teloschistes cf. exilis]